MTTETKNPLDPDKVSKAGVQILKMKEVNDPESWSYVVGGVKIKSNNETITMSVHTGAVTSVSAGAGGISAIRMTTEEALRLMRALAVATGEVSRRQRRKALIAEIADG